MDEGSGAANFARDLADRAAGAMQGENPGDVEAHWRPAEPLALSSRVPQPGPHTLGDQRALQLGHCAQDREYHPARRCGRIDQLAEADEGHAERLERFERPEQMRNRSGEAIELPNDHGVDGLRA